MNRQPLLILVCCFILGILIQDYFSFERDFVFIIALVCLLIAISLFFKSFLISKLNSILIGLLFFGLGISMHFLNFPKTSQISFTTNENITFKISKKLNSTEKNKKYEAIVKIKNQIFNTVLLIPKESKELDFEHYYRAKSYISQPQSPEYDFQFDYAKYLHRKDIFYQCYVNGEISSAKRNDLSFNEKIRQKRLEVLKEINNSAMSSKSQEFLKGIILADRTEIDSETLQDFNRSGLVHFLAISGTHIVVIFGMFYFLLMKFLPLRFRKSVIIVSLGFIWVFALFIGFGSSVVRSCIMLTMYFCYVLLQRKPDLLHALALSAFTILIIDTQQLFDVGFQLSFLAVLGIYWLNQPILKHLPKQNNHFKKIIYNTVSISISAQMVTLPLVLFYFHQFSFVSFAANLFIVPFSEVIIIFSFVMAGLLALGFDFKIINIIYDVTIDLLLTVIHWFADCESLFFENISMNGVEVAMLFVIVYFLRFVIVKSNFRCAPQFSLAVLMFFIVRISFTIYENKRQEVLVHHYKKGKIVSVKNKSSVCFWIENVIDQEKIRQYIINPYISSRRVKNIKIERLPAVSGKVVFNNKIYNLK
ncbi:ComEC family competence protein [Chryseobacterium chendengshani]|uniref:ComEC/Rec2 family competence protein n=1 Tax=Chryseobacterium sp. LJ668 TaxID=2864040 RepID=UPI001C6927A4|nr:ComEC/Rec2 family competence protein [Chryseobacterium sp. LJ668]MBW8524809.1 ComEC family competence protein [Chryseobacterium sp. LJ668]QYK15172.1 ComEC family competence protein [Chryseobacterium sp. LJ668]